MMDITSTVTSVDELIQIIRDGDACAAEAVFKDNGFEKQPSGLWYHKESGLYAAIDAHSNPFGCRYATVCARRIIMDVDSLAALVMVPWYGDGLEMTQAIAVLRASVKAVL